MVGGLRKPTVSTISLGSMPWRYAEVVPRTVCPSWSWMMLTATLSRASSTAWAWGFFFFSFFLFFFLLFFFSFFFFCPGQCGTHDRPSLSRLTPVANLNRQRLSFCFGPRPTRSESLARHTTALITPLTSSVTGPQHKRRSWLVASTSSSPVVAAGGALKSVRPRRRTNKLVRRVGLGRSWLRRVQLATRTPCSNDPTAAVASSTARQPARA